MQTSRQKSANKKRSRGASHGLGALNDHRAYMQTSVNHKPAISQNNATISSFFPADETAGNQHTSKRQSRYDSQGCTSGNSIKGLTVCRRLAADAPPDSNASGDGCSRESSIRATASLSGMPNSRFAMATARDSPPSASTRPTSNARLPLHTRPCKFSKCHYSNTDLQIRQK